MSQKDSDSVEVVSGVKAVLTSVLSDHVIYIHSSPMYQGRYCLSFTILQIHFFQAHSGMLKYCNFAVAGSET